MGFFRKLLAVASRTEVLRLDILMEYSMEHGRGRAALRWTAPMHGGPLARHNPSFCSTAAFCASTWKRAQSSFAEWGELAQANVQSEGVVRVAWEVARFPGRWVVGIGAGRLPGRNASPPIPYSPGSAAPRLATAHTVTAHASRPVARCRYGVARMNAVMVRAATGERSPRRARLESKYGLSRLGTASTTCRCGTSPSRVSFTSPLQTRYPAQTNVKPAHHQLRSE